MTADPLRALRSGVLPPGVERVTARTRGFTAADLNAADFRHLLTRAQNNEISSDRQVLVAPGLDLPLSDSQLARIGKAADMAEASGSRKALVLIDDAAVTIDLATRVVTSRVDLHSAGVLAGVDAVVRAEADEAAAGPSGLLPVPHGQPPRWLAEMFKSSRSEEPQA